MNPTYPKSLEPPAFDLHTGREPSTSLPDVPDQTHESRSLTREPTISRPQNLIQHPDTLQTKMPRALARLLPHNRPGAQELKPLNPTRRSNPLDE